jgi:hypothetical protein
LLDANIARLESGGIRHAKALRKLNLSLCDELLDEGIAVADFPAVEELNLAWTNMNSVTHQGAAPRLLQGLPGLEGA